MNKPMKLMSTPGPKAESQRGWASACWLPEMEEDTEQERGTYLRGYTAGLEEKAWLNFQAAVLLMLIGAAGAFIALLVAGLCAR